MSPAMQIAALQGNLRSFARQLMAFEFGLERHAEDAVALNWAVGELAKLQEVFQTMQLQLQGTDEHPAPAESGERKCQDYCVVPGCLHEAAPGSVYCSRHHAVCHAYCRHGKNINDPCAECFAPREPERAAEPTYPTAAVLLAMAENLLAGVARLTTREEAMSREAIEKALEELRDLEGTFCTRCGLDEGQLSPVHVQSDRARRILEQFRESILEEAAQAAEDADLQSSGSGYMHQDDSRAQRRECAREIRALAQKAPEE